jgi:hypothetical protein
MVAVVEARGASWPVQLSARSICGGGNACRPCFVLPHHGPAPEARQKAASICPSVGGRSHAARQAEVGAMELPGVHGLWVRSGRRGTVLERRAKPRQPSQACAALRAPNSVQPVPRPDRDATPRPITHHAPPHTHTKS